MPRLWRTQASRFQDLAVEVCWRPAQGGVSGDFYDVVDLGDGRAAVVLGDAPGPGAAATEVAEELRFEVRRALRETSRPGAALRLLDEHVAAREPPVSVTAVCAMFAPASGTAEAVNAGHLPIVVADGHDARFLGDQSEPPLGLAADRRSVVHRLAADSALFMFSNGLVERRDQSIERGLAVLLDAARGLTGASAWASELARRTTAVLGQPTEDATIISVSLRRSGGPSGISADRVALRLYVDPNDLRSAATEAVVRELIAGLRGTVEVGLDVVDITRSSRSAEADGVMAAPTVVRFLPAPTVRVVGGIRSANELARVLQLPDPGTTA